MSALGPGPALLALALACGGPDARPEVELRPDGLVVRAEQGIERVVLVDPQGVAVQSRRLPAPVGEVGVDHLFAEGGAWTAQVVAGGRTWELPLQVEAPPPVQVLVEAPVGQQARSLRDGEVVAVPEVDGRPGEVALTVRGLLGGEARVLLGDEERSVTLPPGERLVLRRVVTGPLAFTVQAGAQRLSAELLPRSTSVEELGRTLSLARVDLPADAEGRADLGRPAGRVSLPAAWWRAVLGQLGLGVRARDPWAPWAHVGAVVHNTGAEAQNVVVRLQVLDPSGQPAPAFAPRVREGVVGAGAVQVLLRVPPGEQARAALPLFVDERLLTSDVAASEQWTRVVEVLPLGSPVAVATDRAPLYVSRGSTVASLGLGGALLAALGGTGLLLRRGPGWLSGAATSELMTIALFGSLTFVVGAVGRLLTMGVATVLGPFATLLTGLVDDTLRYALLATLVSLLPRVGTASLAVLVSWLLSGFALGTFAPTDLLFVGGRVFWLELLLWLAGPTRGRAWLDEAPWRQWLRLSLGFGGASLLATATGLVVHVTLYRLFLADWYVGLLLGLPGFLYVVLACALAVPFAASLRRVQR